ncbi:MAG: methyltransferase domain-containing protein [Luteitalea sp.]|nr:methyltransferase domain-containing protein [Luteitalea sp.]
MRVGHLETTARLARPPRAMAWILLMASAAAVLLIGLIGTALIAGHLDAWPTSSRWTFWPQLFVACGLTVASLSLRSLRWIFLLRRSDTRIPIRDAYIGYLAGLSLLFAPFLLGEIAVRAAIHRRRGRVPIATTIVVNVWERIVDAAALGLIAGAAGIVLGGVSPWNAVAATAALLLFATPIRRTLLNAVVPASRAVARAFGESAAPACERLGSMRVWLVGFAAGVVAWMLPGIALWLLAGVWGQPFGIVDAEYAYASSSTLSALAFAPGGVLIAGQQMLSALAAHGIGGSQAALTVVCVRLATVGVSVVLGVVFVAIHRKSAPASSATHFDDIADAYDVQIPESRRHALLERKTELMRDILETRAGGRRGLDVGCGQGAYVGRMRELGFDVRGIDSSAGQVLLAGRNVGEPGVIDSGSVLQIPAADRSYDFLYVINVLHHLASLEEQRRAFSEMLRVLRPGGLLFVHEINTRNLLFRFYMGYVFPSVNCIDEGVERWLLPQSLSLYTDAPVVEVRYFTFLPDFVPQAIARVLAPIEGMLEASRLGVYSAHYMAVLRKEPPAG